MMLAAKYTKQNPVGWLMSEKLNGWRAFWDGSALRTRTWQVIPVPACITESLPVGVCLDGEIHAGRGGFPVIQSLCQTGDLTDPRWGQVRFAVFDFPTTQLLPIESRLNLARKMAVGCQVDFVEHVLIEREDAMWSRFGEVLRANGEGLVIKRPASYYEFDRSSDWLKVKPAGVS